MTFWRCYYHVVWATKGRVPTISPQHEAIIFSCIHHVSAEMNCKIVAINGTADHVHVAAAIPPRVAVAEWVQRVKGASSHEVNVHWSDVPQLFYWQSGYGVLTFGQRRLAFVQQYIAEQKIHHADDTVVSYMEQTAES